MSGWRERDHAPAAGTPLCAFAELPEDNGVERVFGDGPREFRVVVFRVGDGARAYVNECPHADIPFGFAEGVFCVHEIDGRRDLLCAHHSAVFHLDDGLCWDGPCVGARLEPVDVRVRDGTVVVA